MIRKLMPLSVFAVAAFAQSVFAQTIAGRYDATIHIGDQDITFRFDVAGDGTAVQGSFFNGVEKMSSTSGRMEHGNLQLAWDHLATRLDATVKDGVIDGNYIGSVGPRDKGAHAFHAVRSTGEKSGDPNPPSITGLWIIPNNSAKGEKAWRFVVEQKASGEVSAAILRVDGDTGAITGYYKNGKFVLSHFSGFRPDLMEITMKDDGTLDILQNGKTKFTAVRAEQAASKGLPSFTDPTKHTGVKDASDPFRFSFPDLSGKVVSNTDTRFQNKGCWWKSQGAGAPIATTKRRFWLKCTTATTSVDLK
jgi:hypothetical protein